MPESFSHLEKTDQTPLLKKANDLFQSKQFAQAAEIAKKLIDQDEGLAEAWDLLARIALIHGDAGKSIELSRRALIEAPHQSAYYVTAGSALKAQQQTHAASQHFLKALEFDKQNLDALNNLGILELEQGRFEASYEYLKRYLNINPKDAGVCNNLGCIAAMSQQTDQAIEYFQKALENDPKAFDACNNLANMYLNQGDLKQAKHHYELALKLNPQYPDALNNLGNVYKKQGDLEKAEQHYQSALSFHPKHVEAKNNLAIVEMEKYQYQSALSRLKEVLQEAPHFTEAKLNLSLCLIYLESYSEAQTLLQGIIQTDPNQWEAHHQLASVQQFLGNFKGALESFQAVLNSNPTHLDSLLQLAKMYRLAGDLEKSTQLYERILRIDPDHTRARSSLAFIHLKNCDWEPFNTEREKLQVALDQCWKKGHSAEVDPFEAMGLNLPEDAISHVIRDRAAQYAHPFQNQAFAFHKKEHAPIKIGYLSPDFNQHPIGVQLRDMFKYHDRDRFHITCYSLVQSKPNPYTPQIESACDTWVDLHLEGPMQAAERIHRDRIDILVDLAGYTGDAMPDILALQPAPIQCHWLGSSHSLQNPKVPWFISHESMISQADRKHFSESIVYLPRAPYATDPFVDPLPSAHRKDYGLPNDSFIFCCFVQSYRMNERAFSTWMEILKKAPQSVLWLRKDSEQIAKNLKARAAEHSIAPERLFFTEHPVLTERWPHQVADLWLDTLDIASGTGTFLSLWGECPLLAFCGKNAQARTSSALLKACQLEALIASTPEEYIQKAVFYYEDPEEIKKLKNQLKTQKKTLSIFNARSYVQDLEKVYTTLWDRWLKGEPPTDLNFHEH